MDYKQVLGSKIKEARKQAGLKQADLAHLTNISVTSISQWENGHSFPELDNLVLVATVTNKPMAWFFSILVADNSEEEYIVKTYRALNEIGKKFMLELTENLLDVKRYK